MVIWQSCAEAPIADVSATAQAMAATVIERTIRLGLVFNALVGRPGRSTHRFRVVRSDRPLQLLLVVPENVRMLDVARPDRGRICVVYNVFRFLLSEQDKILSTVRENRQRSPYAIVRSADAHP